MMLTAEHKAKLNEIRIARNKLTRRKKAVHDARTQLAMLMGEASALGISQTKIAHACGLSIARIAQLKADGWNPDG